MSDRIIELRVENQRLKKQVENLEKKVLSLVGMTNIESSGGAEKKNVLNDNLMSIFYSTQKQLNIVSPYIDKFYATELKKLTKKGIAVLIIIKDRGSIPPQYQEVYDDLKSTQGIKIINNPNVRYLLIFNSSEALYSGGTLDKEAMEKSILIVTVIREPTQLRKIADIFNLMLPSFMRTKKG